MVAAGEKFINLEVGSQPPLSLPCLAIAAHSSFLLTKVSGSLAEQELMGHHVLMKPSKCFQKEALDM